MTTSARAARFGRVLTAMATPFGPDGTLDLDGAVKLASYLAAHGSDGLVVAGSTGESTVLSDDERELLWREIAAAVSVPVIAGSTVGDTEHSVELTRLATGCGVAGILAVTPYYSRPPQSGLEAHFRAVAAATDLPVVLYDIAVRTGRRIAPETILRLAEVDNIVGLKDAAGEPGATARWLAEVPEDFDCYSGDDLLTLPLLSVGARGLISVAAHWCGIECNEMVVAFLEGRVDEALQLFRAVLPSFAFETSDEAPNPIPTKTMLRLLGLPAGQCRLPLGPAPDGLEERARQVLGGLESFRHSHRADG
jgi:4-hydroxy-tetrahydrodipicolinate synthase